MEGGGLDGEGVEHVLGEVGWQVLRHVGGVVGVPAGLTALDGDAAFEVPSR